MAASYLATCGSVSCPDGLIVGNSLQLGCRAVECRMFNLWCTQNQLSGLVVEWLSRDWEVVSTIPGPVLPKTVEMVPIGSLLGTQHLGLDLGVGSFNDSWA